MCTHRDQRLLSTAATLLTPLRPPALRPLRPPYSLHFLHPPPSTSSTLLPPLRATVYDIPPSTGHVARSILRPQLYQQEARGPSSNCGCVAEGGEEPAYWAENAEAGPGPGTYDPSAGYSKVSNHVACAAVSFTRATRGLAGDHVSTSVRQA